MEYTVEPQALKHAFLADLHSPEQLSALFDHLPDVYFFVKDREHRFILGNRLLLWMCGVQREEDILGRRDADFFSAAIADAYVRDDRQVMSTGRRITNRIEPVQEHDGTINWFVTNKVPLYSHDGTIIGVAGMTRDVRKASHSLRAYDEMAEVLEHIETHYAETIPMERLARMAGLSVGQFERKFRAIVGIPPLRYIIKTRVNKACDALLHTARTVTQVAIDTGFYDHSHLFKQFRRHTGMTPRQYRSRYAPYGGGSATGDRNPSDV